MEEKLGFGKYKTFFNTDVVNLLSNEYQVYPVVTPELFKASAKIRHAVFCEELGYEPERVQKIEYDQYDSHSTHLILKQRSIDSYVGCARIIHGQQDGVQRTLPFEKICRDTADWKIIEEIKGSGKKYCELSRLSVLKTQRSDGAKTLKAGSVGEIGTSIATYALYMGIGALTRYHDIQYYFALIEHKLYRSLQRSGIPAQQIGEPIEFRGRRIPVLISLEQFENSIPFPLWPLYRRISQNISKVYDVAQAQNPKQGSFINLIQMSESEDLKDTFHTV